jgi:hypothetical protein
MAEVIMFIVSVIFIVATIILFGSTAAIKLSISPGELHEMGVWIDHPQC